jgi:Zn-dependent protease
MIEFKLRSVTYRLDFSFFLLWCVVYILGKESLILPTFIACLVHELGHIVALALSGCKVRRIEFSGVGIKIVPQYGRMLPKRWDCAIIVSGCVSNFLLSGVVLLFKLYPLYDIAYVSLSLGVFNALPIKSLDGYDLLQLLVNR